jgi:hypothetical protein
MNGRLLPSGQPSELAGRSGQPYQPDLRRVPWPAPAAAAEATQPAGLSLLKQHVGMEEVPAEGRCLA